MLKAAKDHGISNKEYRARQLAEAEKRYKAGDRKPMKRELRANAALKERLAERAGS